MADDAGLVVVCTYQTIADAQVAKTALESVGIDSTIRNDNKSGQSARGVELLVRPIDLDLATDVLDVEGMQGSSRK
jgi:hypothetical protein